MASNATPPGVIDPTKPGKYPVILSDALKGKSTKEILTAIRYNHRPNLSTDTAPGAAKIKPVPSSSSASSSPASYDLTYTDGGGKYAYNGSRATKEKKYVLIFDPERKAFVLHRVDSTFNMNLTRIPSNNNAESLRQKYPHLEGSVKAPSTAKNSSTLDNEGFIKPPIPVNKLNKPKNPVKSAGMVQSKRPSATASAPPPSAAAATKSSGSKAEPAKGKKKKEEETKAKEPKAKEPKPQRLRSPVDSEDENSEDESGLLVEWPSPQPPTARPVPVTTAPSAPRRFSDVIANQAKSGHDFDEDADAEGEDDDDLLIIEDPAAEAPNTADRFKLPSPVGRQNTVVESQPPPLLDPDEEEPPADEELEALLAQEMGEAMDVDSESSVSEEE